MPKNDIGGFFVSLGMAIDKNSFETGNKLIDGIGNSFNKLIGSARNAALVLGTTAVATGAVESSARKTATALGITTEALDLWKASAKIAGVNAESLVSSIGKIAGVQNRIKYSGSGLDALQTQLDKIRMSYSEIKDLSADEATAAILTKAQGMLNGSNTAEIAAYVEDILGAGGRDFFIEMVNKNWSISDIQGIAGKTIFTTAQDNQNGANFMTEVNTLKVEAQNLSKLFGDKIAEELTPLLSTVNTFIQNHGDEISENIGTIAENIGKLVEKIVGVGSAAWPKIKAAGEVIGDSIAGTYKGIKKTGKAAINGDGAGVIEGLSDTLSAVGSPVTAGVKAVQDSSFAERQRSKNEAEKAIRDYKKKMGYDFLSIPYSELTTDLQEEFDKYATKSLGHYRFAGAVKDGIVRPDGTVTQVAPDDWVFAARNVSDMARAFIPQSYNSVSAPSEYSIVQNFTINGGNDMPQVLRQQAYKGTQDGLLELMSQSSRRLQLMSGTR